MNPSEDRLMRKVLLCVNLAVCVIVFGGNWISGTAVAADESQIVITLDHHRQLFLDNTEYYGRHLKCGCFCWHGWVLIFTLHEH